MGTRTMRGEHDSSTDLDTLDLNAAAAYLHMSPATLREKAKRGLIPGANPGKRWVFLRSALADYLRSLYPVSGQAPLSDCTPKEVQSCHSLNAAKHGGCASRRPMDGEYAKALGLPTANRRRNTTTS